METVIERTEPLEDSQVAEQVTVEPEYGSKNSSVLESVHTDPSTQDREGSTFSAKIAAYQQELESEFKMYEDSLSTRQVDVELEDLDWDELESRYQAEMKLQVSNEQEIMDDFSVRFQVRSHYPHHECYLTYSSNSYSGCRFRMKKRQRGLSRGMYFRSAGESRPLTCV